MRTKRAKDPWRSAKRPGAFLNKIPRLAPKPVPTMIAVGVTALRGPVRVNRTSRIAVPGAYPNPRYHGLHG